MAKLPKFLAGSTAVLLAISLYLQMQVGRERERADAEAKRASALRAKLESVVEARERLETDVYTLRGAIAARSDAAVMTGAGTTTTAVSPARAPAGDPLAGWKPPEFSVEQRSILARLRYGAILRELHVPESQIEALLPVLAESEINGPFRRPGQRQNEPSAADVERNRAQIAAIVGPNKAVEFENLKKTLPARSQLQMYRMQLDEVGTPITPDQQQKLLALMSAREPLPPPGFEPGSNAQNMQRFRDWQQERDRTFREDAAAVLNPEQQKRLEEVSSVQASMVLPPPNPPPGIGGAAGSPPR